MSDRITGRVALRLGDVYRSAYFGRPLFVRLAYWALPVASLGLLALFHFVVGFEDAEESFTLPLVAILVGVVAWLGLLAFLFARISPQQRQISYDIDRQQVAVRDASGAAVIRPWSQIKSCREHDEGFALFLRPAGSHWLIKRAFGPAELDALRRLVRSVLGAS
jgi:YcxB-like protein